MIASAIALFLMAWDGVLSRVEGGVLVLAAVRARYGALLVVGIALTVLGADLLVAGAVDLAVAWGVSEAIIGLTIVAIGTSAPELATTVVATLQDKRDVAVGNLIGSSITNVLVILGLTCLAVPGGVAVSRDVLWVDIPLAAAVAVACYLAYLGTVVFVRA